MRISILKAGCILIIASALLGIAQAQEDSTSGDGSDSSDQSLQQKAEAGDREAQNELGLAAQDQRNYTEALKWFKRSADQGFAPAQVSMGFLYDLGLGVKPDPIEAARWYTLSAAQDDTDGEYDLGLCYLHGSGVRQDWDEAIKWFTRALSHDDDEGRSANGIGLAFEHRPHQDTAKDYTEALQWYLKGAQMGYGESQYNVCRLTAQGLGGIATDYPSAIKWCSQLAQSDDERSALGQYGMGRMYEDGSGVSKDLKVAAEWYSKGAEKGATVCQMTLAKLYSHYPEHEPNLVEAYKWTEVAVSLNDPTAQSYLQELDSRMSPAQVAKAQALAGQWIKDHPPNPEKADHLVIDGKPAVVLRPD